MDALNWCGRAGLMGAILLAGSTMGFCDAGRVIFQSASDGIRTTVFADPVPLRAGPVEIGILLQEENLPRVLTAANLRITFDLAQPLPGATPWNGLGCVTPGQAVTTTTGHGANRLLHSALVGLPLPGEWFARVEWTFENKQGALSFPLAVEPINASGLSTWGPLVALVPLAILVYWRRAVLLSAPKRTILKNRQRGASVGVDGDERNPF